MSEYFLSALVFGLVAGFKPGPLGAIIIQQTLQHGLSHGLKSSLAPIITDGPIILASLLLISYFKGISSFIGILSFVGGVYLIWISGNIFKTKILNYSESASANRSLATAIKVNFLNPNPYLFWFAVGGTYLARGSVIESLVFICVTIGTLVLSKMLIACLVNYYRDFLGGATIFIGYEAAWRIARSIWFVVIKRKLSFVIVELNLKNQF